MHGKAQCRSRARCQGARSFRRQALSKLCVRVLWVQAVIDIREHREISIMQMTIQDAGGKPVTCRGSLDDQQILPNVSASSIIIN